MKYTARILLRNRPSFYTEIESGDHDGWLTSVGGRMSSGGFIICSDVNSGRSRTLVFNALDIVAIELRERPKNETAKQNDATKQ